jgi:hypothetical protein
MSELKLILTRAPSGEKGTFGVLTFADGRPLCVTLEEPWRENKRKESCVPTGIYKCAKFSGNRFRDVWELKAVPNRTAILIHQGNTIEDTEGCILVGQSYGEVRGLPAVLNSGITLERLRGLLPAEFTITIR